MKEKQIIFSIYFPSWFINLYPCAVVHIHFPWWVHGTRCAAGLGNPINTGRTLLPACFVAPSQVGDREGSCGWWMKRALIAAGCRTSCLNIAFLFTSMVQQLNDHDIKKKLPVKGCTKEGEGESLPINVTKEGVKCLTCWKQIIGKFPVCRPTKLLETEVDM